MRWKSQSVGIEIAIRSEEVVVSVGIEITIRSDEVEVSVGIEITIRSDGSFSWDRFHI